MIINIIFVIIIVCMIFVFFSWFKEKTFIEMMGTMIFLIGMAGFGIVFMLIVELLKDVLSE